MSTNSGIIYLVQPAELVGTMRFKVGMSKSPTLDRVKNGYRNGTRYLFIMEIKGLDTLKTMESQIKQIFKKEFKLIAGTEYFEGDENSIKTRFIKRVLVGRNSIQFKEINNPDKCTDCKDGVFEEYVEAFNSPGFCSCKVGETKLLRYLKDEKRRLNEIEKDQKEIECTSCDNTGHHKGFAFDSTTEIRNPGEYCLGYGCDGSCHFGDILIKERERKKEESKKNPYDCGSCHNTGHHKDEKGNYCFNCKWGELLLKEATRLFIENQKKIMKDVPHMYEEDIEEYKKLLTENINHLNQN
tara:strand:- start:13 stop:906 length:894 start_codon:yes stop_codon:yes gene_type:complete